MLACRVLAGEYTKGRKYDPDLSKSDRQGKSPEELGIVAPTRIASSKTQYDSTTNGKGGDTPDMFVTCVQGPARTSQRFYLTLS